MGRLRKNLARLLATAILCAAWSCQRPTNPPNQSSSTLGAGDILRRCVDVYRRLSTFVAVGTLNDDRGGKSAPVPIRWEYERPNRFRLGIGDSVALVVGDGWWTLDERSGAWRKHHQFTKTPIATAAHLLSRGIPFLTSMLLTKPDRALAGDEQAGFGAWRLEGADWAGGRPCYVLRRPRAVRDGQGDVRIRIDQDSFVVRSWSISVPGLDGEDEIIVSCAYDVVNIDRPIPAERFQLSNRARTALPGRPLE